MSESSRLFLGLGIHPEGGTFHSPMISIIEDENASRFRFRSAEFRKIGFAKIVCATSGKQRSVSERAAAIITIDVATQRDTLTNN